jgi:hypothetical protein
VEHSPLKAWLLGDHDGRIKNLLQPAVEIRLSSVPAIVG